MTTTDYLSALVLGFFGTGLAILLASIIGLAVLLSGPDLVPGCEDRASDYCQALAGDRADD